MPPSTRTAERPRARPKGTPRRRRGPRLGVVVLVLLALTAGAVWVWRQGRVGGITVRAFCETGVGTALVDLDPEQSGNAATIAAIAMRRGLPARAATIGIATAMQESKLRNLSHGDRDSLGLFQQRPSQGWGTQDQVQDPVYATNAFYDVLVKVEGYENLPVTKAAQKVQRSAYPAAYAQHETQARALASALSGFSPAALTCTLADPVVAAQQPGAAGLTPRSSALVKAAGEETGAVVRGPGDAKGSSVKLAPPAAAKGKDATRRAWAIGSWAVSRADALDVVAVSTNGKRWTRQGSWTTDATAPVGQVLVTLAN